MNEERSIGLGIYAVASLRRPGLGVSLVIRGRGSGVAVLIGEHRGARTVIGDACFLLRAVDVCLLTRRVPNAFAIDRCDRHFFVTVLVHLGGRGGRCAVLRFGRNGCPLRTVSPVEVDVCSVVPSRFLTSVKVEPVLYFTSVFELLVPSGYCVSVVVVTLYPAETVAVVVVVEPSGLYTVSVLGSSFSTTGDGVSSETFTVVRGREVGCS